MMKILQMLERVFVSKKNNSHAPRLTARLARVEPLEDRALLSAASFGNTILSQASENSKYTIERLSILEHLSDIIVDLTKPSETPTDEEIIEASYLALDGTTPSVQAKVVNKSMDGEWSEGWYIVNSDVLMLGSSITCKGAVNLILADDCSLSVTGSIGSAGINVSGDGNSLTIYGQVQGTGELTAVGGFNAAGIGGNKNETGENITINGGDVYAKGGTNGAGIGGGYLGSGRFIEINDGSINSVAGLFAAGIGGGNGGDGYDITVNAGTISASSLLSGAGIGGGNGGAGQSITINDGSVNATGGRGGAGIGGGNGGVGKVISVIEGSVTVKGGENGAGIGGGSEGACESITISGGMTNATGGDGGAGIGGGSGAGSNGILIDGEAIVVANGGSDGAGIGGGSQGAGVNITITGGDVSANGGSDAAGIGGGEGGIGKDIAINAGLVTAIGQGDASGVGSGKNGAKAKNISISQNLIVLAGEDADSLKSIVNRSDDLAEVLGGKQYVDIMPKAQFSYIDENGALATTGFADIVDSTMTGEWSSGWYVVYNDVVIPSSSISCKGDVYLVIADGCSLTVTGAENCAAINVSGDGNSLHIYGQTKGTGVLNAFGGANAAGLGGNDSQSGGNIAIYGCTINATGGDNAAAIGGGRKGLGENIEIGAGKVNANGGSKAAAIGGGYQGRGENITIKGGTVTAIANNHTNAIGSGSGASSSEEIRVDTDLSVKAGTKSEVSIISNGGGDLTESLIGSKYVCIEPKVEVVYVENGVTKSADAIVVDGTMKKDWADGWYIVNGKNVQLLNAAITCNGAVNLILADSCSLTVTGTAENAGINISGSKSSLTIYGQKKGTGYLSATGGEYGAGIGGNNGQDGEYIAIYGGKIVANGGNGAAGIGGGYEGAGEHIAIYGGDVTARGNTNGAGVGGGEGGVGDYIAIDGGKLYAIGGDGAAGIGGGYLQNGQHIEINGGDVVAEGGKAGAGIGGGATSNLLKTCGNGENITITGGKVSATGGDLGAGIGGGGSTVVTFGGGDCSNVTISGGTVEAIGGIKAAGIGGGGYDFGANLGGNCKNINISGGTVSATAGTNDDAQIIPASAIGTASGSYKFADNIVVYLESTITADGNPVENTGDDLTKAFWAKGNVEIEPSVNTFEKPLEVLPNDDEWEDLDAGLLDESKPDADNADDPLVDDIVDDLANVLE